jgi:hypothetical protein
LHPVTHEPGVYELRPADLETAASAEARAGATVFRLPSGITSKAGFFDGICGSLPLDPPLMRVTDVWDALHDSLSGGLMEVDEPRIVIVWHDSETLIQADPDAGRIALEILSELPRTLCDADLTAGCTKEVVVLLGTNRRAR